MKKIFAALLLFSAPLFAAPKADVAVFSSIEVEPTNGGFNPAYAGVKLSGTVFAGGNSCEAGRYKVTVKKQIVDGILTFSATKRSVKNDIFCPLFIEPGFLGAGFEKTFIVDRALLATAVVKNVEELGNDVTLASLSGEEAPVTETGCENVSETVFCTMEYNPTTCTYGDITASGTNGCSASANLRRSVCSAEGSFNPAEAVCKSNLDSEI